tara:strand:+ start:316 stop:1125 length:810 start_codon:yes stop_codon:yes gene_type:complete
MAADDQGKPAYWDDLAQEYDTEILSSFHENVNNTIKAALDAVHDGTPPKSAANCIDFGCGVGKYLPALAERFTRVVGLDFSGGLVARAKLRLASTTNVEVFQADLTQRRRINEALSESVVGFEPIAFAVCTNVLLAPSTKARMSILRNLFATVAEDGTVLLVVPSRESALFVNHVLRRWQGDDVARREGLSGRKDDVLVGLLNRGETLTKHYLREEIILDCEDVGFEVKSSAKVEYKWSTEFEFATKKVPKKVKGCALPWDWLLVLRRT